MKLGDTLDLVPGLTHLESLVGHPAFEAACFAHARDGHFQALLEVAKEGRPEPAAALLSVGAKEASIEAASLALERHPEANIVAWLAATSGLEIDDLLCSLLPHLKSRRAVTLLLARSAPFPKTHYRLRILLPAVR